MNPFMWDEANTFGHAEIDADHRALVRITEELHDHIEDGTAEDGLGGLLARLKSYSNFHFETEENLMRQSRYPDYEEHRREHERFVKTLAQLSKRTTEIADDLMVFLHMWVDQHTCNSDRRMMEHVKRL